jgi:hypothetical protein
MKADITDERLQQLFGTMRQQDAAHAPAFEAMSQALPSPAMWGWPRVLVAAASLVVCVGLTIGYVERRRSAQELTQFATLSSWQAATDSLLTSTASPLGRTLTTPTDAWLDIPLTVPD